MVADRYVGEAWNAITLNNEVERKIIIEYLKKHPGSERKYVTEIYNFNHFAQHNAPCFAKVSFGIRVNAVIERLELTYFDGSTYLYERHECYIDKLKPESEEGEPGSETTEPSAPNM